MIRVLVADDHPIVRRGLCSLLQAEPDFEIISEAATGAEAIAQSSALQPDVIVLDISLPDFSGIEAARRIREIAPSVELLLVSEQDGPIVQAAFAAGARGYLLKSDSAAELATAIRAVSQKQRYLSARFLPEGKRQPPDG